MTARYIPQITPPVVNLNGTSKEALVNQHLTVINYLRVAAKAMHEAFPHGRDFQTISPIDGQRTAFKMATDQARARSVKIEELIIDFETLVLAIDRQ